MSSASPPTMEAENERHGALRLANALMRLRFDVVSAVMFALALLLVDAGTFARVAGAEALRADALHAGSPLRAATDRDTAKQAVIQSSAQNERPGSSGSSDAATPSSRYTVARPSNWWRRTSTSEPAVAAHVSTGGDARAPPAFE